MKSSFGFTLLELLIGLTLLGFVMALLFGGFRLASMSWDSVETRLELTNKEQMARSTIRRMLQQMQPIRWKKSQNQAIAFIGDAEGLRAIVPVGGALGEGLQVIELTADVGVGKARLLFRHMPINQNSSEFSAEIEQTKEHVLLDEQLIIRFEYFGPAQRGATPGWQDAWTNIEELPRLVRLRLQSSDTGWTDLLVAPMLVNSGCRWDNFSKRCL